MCVFECELVIQARTKRRLLDSGSEGQVGPPSSEREQGRVTHWKRILIFIVLFVILAVSLFIYVLPNVLHPLRVDAVPAGAYVVPWMSPNPSVKDLEAKWPQQPYGPPFFDIDSVMADALKLTMTLNISILGGSRIVPSTVYLGHDSTDLYVGGKFVGMYGNPVTPSTPGPNNPIRPNIMDILFDVNNDGVLETPESGSRIGAFVYAGEAFAVEYVDKLWVYVPMYGRASWILSNNYYSEFLHKPQTVMAYDYYTGEYDNSTGTVTMIFSRLLNCPGNIEANTLQMRPGERWVMGFLSEMGLETDISSFGDYMDGWPRNDYPYLSGNCSWWPKLAIDLTNPPPAYSGTPTSNNQSSA
jgi:hypothetical protein